MKRRTRVRNIMDVFCTNYRVFVLSRDVSKVSFSHHHLVIMLVFDEPGRRWPELRNALLMVFEQLDFCSLGDSDYCGTLRDISACEWNASEQPYRLMTI